MNRVNIPRERQNLEGYTRGADARHLDAFFRPNTVAVIGATGREGSVGRTTTENLITSSYSGKVFPVNPKYTAVLGHPAYARIGDVPSRVDLAIIATPAASVPGLISECIDADVKAAIILSAGFRERGAQGEQLEQQIAERLKGSRLRVVGPNCLGIMNPLIGLNATFAQKIAGKGKVAFLSQSGALLTAILDWSLREKVGFSAFVSTGSMLDVGWGDLIDYFGMDSETHSILIYMESVGDARSFLSAARAVAMSKPIITIKAGRSEAASKAAASHTGALTGNDEVFDAALRRCGVLRVQGLSEIFDMAEVLSKQPRPRGPRLLILTNAGGPGVLATDALIASGGELATLSEDSRKGFDNLLPPFWSHGNPVDILGDADPERYARVLEIAMRDPGNDGLLVILAPQGMTDPGRVAERLRPYAKGHGKPVLACWMGAAAIEKGRERLNSAGIPTFEYPDTAVRAFEYMWRYSCHLRGLYETPAIADDPAVAQERARKAREILDSVSLQGRTLLTELESKQILSLYDIPTTPTRLACSADEAVAAAREIGYPVVVKLHSHKITHKTDVGGVQLDLRTADAVRAAYRAIETTVTARAGAKSFQGVTVQPMVLRAGYELILGSSVDAEFGPVLLFGSGGQLVEVYRDRALGLPPLTTTLAQRLMEQTKIYKALKGTRGRAPIDLRLLESLLVRFSYIPLELPRIREIDVNPLQASPDGLLALDARIVLFEGAVEDRVLPRPAIRPYPTQYVWRWQMRNGPQVFIRPIRPEDEPLIVRLHESLSDQTVYLRYFHMEKLSSRVAHERLLRKCFIDYDREMALVAEAGEGGSGGREILAVGRLTRYRSAPRAELSVLVTDRVQNRGLGTELVRRLIEVARREGLESVAAQILASNSGMRRLADRFGFRAQPGGEPGEITALLEL